MGEPRPKEFRGPHMAESQAPWRTGAPGVDPSPQCCFASCPALEMGDARLFQSLNPIHMQPAPVIHHDMEPKVPERTQK